MATIERRRSKDGAVRWRALVRIAGHPAMSATFSTESKAERWAARTETQIHDGKHLPTARNRRTFRELVLVYTNREPVRDKDGRAKLDKTGQPILGGNPAFLDLVPKEQAKRTNELDWWSERLGHYALGAITPSLVIEGRDALAAEGPSGRPVSVATQNRYLASLRAALSFAVGRDWLQSNPVAKRKGKDALTRPEPRGRVRYLDSDERRALLDAARASDDPRLYALVVLAVCTGGRQGELLNLRWRDVQLDRGIAVAEDTKNGERRALPLTGPALDVLCELSKVRRIDTDLLFADADGRATFPQRAWMRALRTAKLDHPRTDRRHLTFHDLRHECASQLAMSGATLAEIAEVLGHKTLAMVKRYAHLAEGHTLSVVERMTSKVFGA